MMGFGNLFSQEASSESFSKIKFTYVQKPTLKIDQNKVYADTLVLALEFPDKQFYKSNENKYPSYYGFIPLKELSKAQLERLKGILYHAAQYIEGEYDLKTNITKFNVTRDDKEMRTIFKEAFKSGYSRFVYTVTYDYNKRKIVKKFPSVTYSDSFEKESHFLNFTDETKMKAKYEYKTDTKSYTSIVLLNKELNSKIIPDELFANAEYGVQKLTSTYNSFELESVQYE